MSYGKHRKISIIHSSIFISTLGWLKLWKACLNWFSKKEAYWLLKKKKKKKACCWRGRLHVSSLSRRSTSHVDQLRCDKCSVINERQHSVANGFAKGAITLGPFWKAQHCIFYMFLRGFKMYFYDNVRWKKRLNPRSLAALTLLEK